jgi:PAS domain S-box-containing protein
MSEGSNGRILILEDDPGVARLQQRRLERAGYTVLTTLTPEEALGRLRQGGVDLLVLDYRLPREVNGLDFYAQLKEAGHDLPVILVTGFSEDATVIRALRAGVRDFVTKSREYLDYLPEAARRVLKQVRTEAQLAESRARLAAIINAAMDGVVTIGPDQRITLLNPAAEEIFRCRSHEAVGQPISRFVPAGLPSERAGPTTTDPPGKNLLRYLSREMLGRRAGGEEFPLEASCSEVEVSGQALSILVVRDITARKQAEQALREGNRNLERAMAELRAKGEELQTMTQQLWQAAKLATVGELAASIAHELNNPLATVSLRVEAVLAQTPPGDPRRRPLEIIEQETERMGNLVGNLLQFSRRGPEQVSTVDIREELLKALELVQYQLRQRRIQVVQNLTPELPSLYADRQQLRQVFLNLLTNASDAMRQGGTLTLRAVPGALDDGRRAVVIDLADTGVGIPPELLPRVAEPFFTTKPEGKGTGLGLAICRRIVQEHHGTMRIASEPGKGTTVSLALPVESGTNVDRLRST